MIVQVDYEGPSKLMPVLLTMLESEELCNFTIKSGNKCVQAHKCILAASLEYFRTSFRFSQECSDKSSIDLTHLNCDISIIQLVISCLYSNEIDLNHDNIEGILCLADYLLYKDLTICVERFMENTLDLKSTIFYFKLCIQYNLCNTSLFANVRRLLRGRFHDYLIYEAENLELDMDVFSAMHSYGLLVNCTPLQLMSFFLKKLSRNLIPSRESTQEERNRIINFLELILTNDNKTFKYFRNPYLRTFLNDWQQIHSKQLEDNKSVLAKLNCMAMKFSSTHGDINESEVEPNDETADVKSLQFQGKDSESDSFMNSTTSSNNQTDLNSPISEPRSTSSLSQFQSTESTNSKHEKVPDDTYLCPVIIVLTPSSDMLSQLMDVEAGKMKPLLKAPKLCLHMYDIEMRMWRDAIPLYFPIAGHMLEKHSWRLALAGGNLYMFSLVKKVGLEYSLMNSKWTDLACDEIFIDHANSQNDKFPVKSIIPMSVGDELVILSMSREPRPGGTYWTQQHIYQFNQDTKSFKHIHVVHDERMDLPITKWTVKGDELFTIKASTVMYSDLHVYNVQYIHIYNAKTKEMKTKNVQSAMKTGLKVLVQAGKLYMLNDLGEYRQLDLSTSILSDWDRITNPAFTTPNTSVHVSERDEFYPALLRTTCSAGSSRWTISAQDNIGSASLQEMYVNKEGEFHIGFHPSPTFLHHTAMCVAEIKRKILDGKEQARFDPHAMA